MLIVQKYGGTSLADTARIRTAAQRLVQAARSGHQVVAVVSAQGDLTDRLVEKVHSVTAAPSARESDACLSAGEQISAALVAMAVEELGYGAVSLTGWQAGLVTDTAYSEAHIRFLRGDRIRKELERGKVVVVAGFQGIDRRENITTLGRGGSDTTAVALTALLNADRCIIYTDVDGVYDKDPRKHPDAVKYKHVGYDEMLQLCKQGAQVLHDRCVELAKECNIRIEVRSAFSDEPGTIVGYLQPF
jgi:aspartate kinase